MKLVYKNSLCNEKVEYGVGGGVRAGLWFLIAFKDSLNVRLQPDLADWTTRWERREFSL
jgi:hypothetical protein